MKENRPGQTQEVLSRINEGSPTQFNVKKKTIIGDPIF
jgi:hypothetical protein